MESERLDLYKELGFADRQAEDDTTLDRLAHRATSFDDHATSPQLGEVVEVVRQELEKDPQAFAAIVSESLRIQVSTAELRRTLAELDFADRRPGVVAESLRMQRQLLRATFCPPPPDLPTDFVIEPCSHRYEPLADLRGWVANSGIPWVKQKLGTLRCAPLKAHGDSQSDFVYRMQKPDGAEFTADDSIVIVLFSDFGTGEYNSLFIAKYISEMDPPPAYVIHLGDVYYAGRGFEFNRHFIAPLDPVRARSRFFALNANHEMYAGGFPYFACLESNASWRGPVPQEQEGSYFCIRSPRYQIIGIDTAYDYKHNGQFLDPSMREWLRARLKEGRSQRPPLATILLSHNAPFGLADDRANLLFEQIGECAREDGAWMFGFWFWGDEHYCALYEKSSEIPFVGSCIGHAGHPVDLRSLLRDAELNRRGKGFAKAAWVDLSPRFRSMRIDDLGNSGFCTMRLSPSGIELAYIDWLNQRHKTIQFT